jgi:hypothetical protein
MPRSEEQTRRVAGTVALPVRGEVFLDARDAGRALRVSWHHEDELVVLSLWRGHKCTGTFQLEADDVRAFVQALTDGLAEGCDGEHAAPPEAV